jgi:hypothetical protein
MASAELSRRIGKAVGYSPLSEMGDLQRREFHDALLEADDFEDLPGEWQAAILKAGRTGRNSASSARSESAPGETPEAARLCLVRCTRVDAEASAVLAQKVGRGCELDHRGDPVAPPRTLGARQRDVSETSAKRQRVVFSRSVPKQTARAKEG